MSKKKSKLEWYRGLNQTRKGEVHTNIVIGAVIVAMMAGGIGLAVTCGPAGIVLGIGINLLGILALILLLAGAGIQGSKDD